MTVKTKIWLLLGALVGLILVVDLTISYRKLSRELQAESEFDARTVFGFMMATRRVYQEQFVASGLPVTRKTVGFLPAHSFSRISADFPNWNRSGIIFNNVSDRPRNPRNKADRFELESMAWFRANPDLVEQMRHIIDDKGVGYLLYTAPIRIEAFCLKCHGAEAESPPSIREAYAGAYDYKVGDLRGLVSIKIPSEKFEQRRAEIWGGQLVKSLLGYAILFFGIGVLLDRLVTRRLAHLEGGAERIAAGDYAARVDADGADEVARLAQTFNRMADEVQARDGTLGKLSQAIEQSPESIVITDLDCRIEYVNAFFLKNTGYPREEVLGRNPRFLKSGKTPPETYNSLWETLTRGQVWRGEFVNRRKDGSEFLDAATVAPVRGGSGRITHYLSVQQDITEQRRAEAQINRLEYFDALTGLPNRALLLDRLGLALAIAHRKGRLDGLILFNIDRFKNLNDACGHELGNALLIAVGGRLAKQLREGDTLAHLSGDEFAILLQDLGPHLDAASRRAMAVAEKFHADLRQPFRLGANDEATLTASLGITLCPESDSDMPQDILRRADTALHRAKDAGGNQTAFFDVSMGESAAMRFRVERELRRAIPANELRLFLQPQVDRTGRLVGAECLVRWQHPERGLVPPAAFIPIAEESDLIIDLSAWVLAEACKLMVHEDLAGHPLRLSVNISPRHFRQPHFVSWLLDLLDASGADASQLTLEVTEGLVIDNINDVVAKMGELAARGIHFSLDDFGTGYSSLAYLKRLPINEVKIDKTFVQDAPTDPNDAALVEAILSVARHLHLEVVAEGVETAEQVAFLNERGHVIHQGYYFGRPEPAQAWIDRWHAGTVPRPG
ncbi:MAG: EAL domain-containing protein [Gammaproteobacteria bacterium]|nr:EAL domain-containing protein [Gammaproteobacteria bacterium]MBU1645949.1 EAL domain-containing protein [Gammaproteobacteria bacterium]MBU1972011.1 EAL domain-containing protein [Gammaproteobacteria bacterium]